MTIHLASADTLSEVQQKYLDNAISWFVDHLVDDITTLREREGSEALDLTVVGDHLPPTRSRFYSPVFVQKFYVCIITVAWKYHSPDPQELACVAEELALYALLRLAESLAELDGAQVDFSNCEDLFFEDMDFELLFDPSWDGFDADEGLEHLGYANLKVGDWFKPFRLEDPVHPYVGRS